MQVDRTQQSIARPQFLLAGLLLCLIAASALAENDNHVFTLGIDGGYVTTDTPLASWTEGGLGKLRYDEDSDGVKLSHVFLDYRGRLTQTLNLKATLMYNPELSNKLDFTEAYFELRPIPQSRWRTRFRLGAFYPHLSMENVDNAWTSPYTLSSSTINTWLAEELRIIGAEGKVLRDFGKTSQHRVSFEGGVFWVNDPTGALLAAKGWSVHNRQSGIRAELPLHFGTTFEPFQELDDQAGFYAGTQYQYGRRIKLKYHHYNNHGNPKQGPEWGDTWLTYFDSAGLQLALPAKVGLIGQWLDGRTVWQDLDIGFDAWTVLLTRTFNKHRVSVRYEEFFMDKQASNWGPQQVLDDGQALTVAWLFSYSRSVRFGVEWINIESTRPQFVDAGFEPTIDENQLMLSIRYLLSNKAK
ncbi:MAG: hypothetical protein E2O52_06515 [Gammaproteobacteria bacterium]|nr:MAG: hypothetical protein E2O52_06515 [Gammaproteobacteria bacterium]